MKGVATGRRLLPGVVVLGVLAATAAAALAGTVSWGSAIEVPGMAALNLGGSASVYSASCASAGACAVGGSYTESSLAGRAYVSSEQGGVWGAAIEVPDTTAPTVEGVPGIASVESVSCGGAGDCAAGGAIWTYYGDYLGQYLGQAYLVDETNGAWGTAIEVPGLSSYNAGHNSAVTSMSCVSPGNCAASGYFAGDTDHHYGFPEDYAGFLVSEHGGVWGKALAVWNSSINEVSCAGVGYCVAGGSEDGHAFLVTERNGEWLIGPKVPGLKTLSGGGSSRVTSVSCASPGNCAAGGVYTYGPRGHREYAFVVSETNGKWGKATEVMTTPGLKVGRVAGVASVSCASAGNCVAGGYYIDSAQKTQAFVVAATHGTWGKGIKVPGTAALNAGGAAEVSSVSCASTGGCVAGGSYTNSSHKTQAFVAAKHGGAWSKAVEVPGTAALNVRGGAAATSVSCARGGGSCAVGGTYVDGDGHNQAFVTAP